MKPKNEQELLDYIFHVAKSCSRDLLDRFGTVPAWGIALVPPDFSPRTVFPMDRLPGVEFSQLLDAVAGDLRAILDEIPDLPTAIIVCGVQSGSDNGLIVQVESPNAVSTFLFPYRKHMLHGWVFEDPQFIEDQFADSVYPLPDVAEHVEKD